MIDSLHAPADLGTARAQLRSQLTEEAARGPILHLRAPGSPGSGPGRWPHLPGSVSGAPGDPTERPATVVADTILWRASAADLRSLAESLGRDQVLWFLEPTAEVGWRRLVHRLARPLWRRLAGHHYELDVPAALRSAGLQVTELNRFGVGLGEVRSYALGRAEHIRTT